MTTQNLIPAHERFDTCYYCGKSEPTTKLDLCDVCLHDIKSVAEYSRMAYRTGQLDMKEAMDRSQPFVDHYNKRSKEIAKKYGKKPKLMTARNWLSQRSGIRF